MSDIDPATATVYRPTTARLPIVPRWRCLGLEVAADADLKPIASTWHASEIEALVLGASQIEKGLWRSFTVECRYFADPTAPKPKGNA